SGNEKDILSSPQAGSSACQRIRPSNDQTVGPPNRARQAGRQPCCPTTEKPRPALPASRGAAGALRAAPFLPQSDLRILAMRTAILAEKDNVWLYLPQIEVPPQFDPSRGAGFLHGLMSLVLCGGVHTSIQGV